MARSRNLGPSSRPGYLILSRQERDLAKLLIEHQYVPYMMMADRLWPHSEMPYQQKLSGVKQRLEKKTRIHIYMASKRGYFVNDEGRTALRNYMEKLK